MGFLNKNALVVLRGIWLLFIPLIFWQGTLSQPAQVTLVVNDKIGHLLVFSALCFFGLVLWSSIKTKIRLMVFLVFFGMAIECAQYFVPMRTFSLLDWVADVCGVLMGWLLYKTGCIEKLSTRG